MYICLYAITTDQGNIAFPMGIHNPYRIKFLMKQKYMLFAVIWEISGIRFPKTIPFFLLQFKIQNTLY